VHRHAGNARVVGFFGLEPKSVGAAVDLVVDQVAPGRRRSQYFDDRRQDESACLPM
jgi:hypothetical protein